MAMANTEDNVPQDLTYPGDYFANLKAFLQGTIAPRSNIDSNLRNIPGMFKWLRDTTPSAVSANDQLDYAVRNNYKDIYEYCEKYYAQENVVYYKSAADMITSIERGGVGSTASACKDLLERYREFVNKSLSESNVSYAEETIFRNSLPDTEGYIKSMDAALGAYGSLEPVRDQMRKPLNKMYDEFLKTKDPKYASKIQEAKDLHPGDVEVDVVFWLEYRYSIFRDFAIEQMKAGNPTFENAVNMVELGGLVFNEPRVGENLFTKYQTHLEQKTEILMKNCKINLEKSKMDAITDSIAKLKEKGTKLKTYEDIFSDGSGLPTYDNDVFDEKDDSATSAAEKAKKEAEKKRQTEAEQAKDKANKLNEFESSGLMLKPSETEKIEENFDNELNEDKEEKGDRKQPHEDPAVAEGGI